MSKTPPVPKEQRSFRGKRVEAADTSARDRRDDHTELQSGQPGDADANLEEQGRFGNIHQNLTPHRSTQDR